MSNYVTAWYEMYDRSSDGNGNRTAHYTLWVDGEVSIRTKRRRQIGYAGVGHQDAEHALRGLVKSKYPGSILIVDPSDHPWPYGGHQRVSGDTIHYVIAPPEFIHSAEFNRLRLLGLVPGITQRIMDAAEHGIRHAPTEVISVVATDDEAANLVAQLIGASTWNASKT